MSETDRAAMTDLAEMRTTLIDCVIEGMYPISGADAEAYIDRFAAEVERATRKKVAAEVREAHCA